MSTVRALVQEEQQLSLDLQDLNEWLEAKKDGRLETRVEVSWKFKSEGDPEHAKFLHSAYAAGITAEVLAELVEKRLESIIEAKNRRLDSIRRQLKELDQKLGVIIQ